MKLLHTADWHLGQTLHGVPRTFEHERFLVWLGDTLEKEEIDVLVVAGDVFDTASPTAIAQAQYYRFLAECRRRSKELQIVVVGGNHDSASRLDAPKELLSALGIHVVGGLDQGRADPAALERSIVPLRDRKKKQSAQLLAVPFLRPRDLPEGPSEQERTAQHRVVEGHRSLYAALTAAAEARRGKKEALVATGHCYMTGGIVSELSERKIQMGNQLALPVEVFPDSLAYVALGHLHRAQAVGGKEHVRYSGSPIPLSMIERSYEHQVVLVELDGRELREIRPLYVPRTIDLLALPEAHLQLSRVLDILRALPREGPPGASEEQKPLVEVRVWLEDAQPRLRAEIESALRGAWARLVRIDVKRPDRKVEEILPASADLSSLSPVEVFRAAYSRQRRRPASMELVTLFESLLDEVKSGSDPA